MMSNMDFPAFAVACGEEGSDPLVLRVGRVVRVDQYRASGHLERLDADLADVGGLGVKVWRYGMPWRLTESEPGVYDWTLWDRALEACARGIAFFDGFAGRNAAGWNPTIGRSRRAVGVTDASGNSLHGSCRPRRRPVQEGLTFYCSFYCAVRYRGIRIGTAGVS